MHKLPVLITVWNNHWAIMTEQQAQWAGDLTAQVRAMDAIAVDVDAVDPLEVYETARQLTARLRNGEGPAFMHLHGGLLDAHSSSTDIRRYRTREEIEETARTKDPVKRMGEMLVERGLLARGRYRAHARRDQGARSTPPRSRCSPSRRFPPSASPSASSRFLALAAAAASGADASKMLMIEAINDALVEIVKRDPGFFVYGQDVGSSTGGVFNATARLVKEYPGTAISSALNEQLIAGIAAGCGMADDKARCGEIQFVDYHQSATQTIRLAARIYYQSYRRLELPDDPAHEVWLRRRRPDLR